MSYSLDFSAVYERLPELLVACLATIGLAIAGMGLRDVAIDQGLPRPLSLYRGGQRLKGLHDIETQRLNDQHVFLSLKGDNDVQVGDVVEFGISHPCTCLDRHRIIYGLDPEGTVTGAFLTSFG